MKITKELQEKVLPLLAQKYGIETALEGASLEEADAMTDLALGFLLALFVIYALLAIPLKSYTRAADYYVGDPFWFNWGDFRPYAAGIECQYYVFVWLDCAGWGSGE